MNVSLTENHDSGGAPVELTKAQAARRRGRSIAIALVLGGLALLFYIVTIVKLGPNVLDRPL